MVRIPKIVAVVLMMAALAWPAAALAACWTYTDSGASGMDCPPECPMMARQSSTVDQVVSESHGGSCCNISSDKSAPAAIPQVPVNMSQAGVAPDKMTMPIDLSAQARRNDVGVEILAPDTSPQAVLCTFLI